MPVTLREPAEQLRVQPKRCCRIDRIHAVFFINRLPQGQSPSSGTLLEEIVKTAGADDVAEHLVHERALRNRHLGLGHGAPGGYFNRHAAQKVEDADAARPPLATDTDELV